MIELYEATELERLTLRAQLAENQRLFAQTGHYHGITKLTVKEEDPLFYERLHSRLRSTVVSAREMSRRIAASPGVREIGEMLVALYTPDGDAIALSTGILVHTHTMSRFIKWMIENDYENDPGINPGDIFANNDAFIGSVQIPDVMDAVPIFYDGELVGWAAAVCHELEVGGITPGGDVALAQERFGEGMFVCAEKVGTNDDLRRDYIIRCERCLREPIYWIMDAKAKVSACLEVRDRVVALIDEIGVEAYNAATREFIEEGRRAQLDRMKIMSVPGRYSGVTFYGHVVERGGLLPLGEGNTIFHAPLDLTVDSDGLMTLDFEGAGPWGYHSLNATPAAMDGGFFVTLTQSIGYDGKVNDGSYLATRIHLPEGSWTNPGTHLAATATCWGIMLPAYGCFQRLLSRAFYARGFHEEVFVGQVNTPMIEGGGTSQFGRPFGCALFECGAAGSGARGIMDGIDWGYAGWNPESDMGNAEIWELSVPWVYLGRKTDIDSCGFGKFRGGAAFSSLWLIHKTPGLMLATSEHSARVFDNAGLCGGYPASTLHYHYAVRDAGIAELAAKWAPIPRQAEVAGRSDELEALNAREFEVKDGVWAGKLLTDGDLFSHSYNSGGGFGDPLERDPALIEGDLESGIVSVRASEAISGAVIVEHNGYLAVDREATERRRREIRARRLERSVPVSEWVVGERKRLQTSEFVPEVARMYANSMRLSPRWSARFLEFWGLPEDFEMRSRKEATP